MTRSGGSVPSASMLTETMHNIRPTPRTAWEANSSQKAQSLVTGSSWKQESANSASPMPIIQRGSTAAARLPATGAASIMKAPVTKTVLPISGAS